MMADVFTMQTITDKVIPQQNSIKEFGVFVKLSGEPHTNWKRFFSDLSKN